MALYYSFISIVFENWIDFDFIYESRYNIKCLKQKKGLDRVPFKNMLNEIT